MPKLDQGGGISFDQFFAAIGGQESGGNYNATNSRTGASGKYQIMPGNIGPWSQQYLGKRISVSQFRSSPQLQEQLARAVLSDYFHKWGARGAAAAWYSGSPDKKDDYKRFRSNEPSVGEYADQVLARVGQTGLPAAPAVAAPLKATVQPAQPVLGGGFKDSAIAAPQDPFGSAAGDPLAVSPDSLGRTEQASGLPGAEITPGTHGTDPTRDKILAEAMRYIGTPYVWGGTGPKGFDCSGLIQYVYKQFGINLPRISADQARFGSRVNLNQLRPGDLVAADNSSRNNGADHIAIYAGDGYIIEAPHAGASVRRRKIGADEGFYGVSLSI